uniref:Uncharacterized protein n=1 Tax=Spongospora subterranea TaxID=70186 RepID=A0A0H5R410_9EUKA|eukprot:CRZ08645.1 hypothetical protein [Spongospora subterranea]
MKCDVSVSEHGVSVERLSASALVRADGTDGVSFRFSECNTIRQSSARALGRQIGDPNTVAFWHNVEAVYDDASSSSLVFFRRDASLPVMPSFDRPASTILLAVASGMPKYTKSWDGGGKRPTIRHDCIRFHEGIR